MEEEEDKLLLAVLAKASESSTTAESLERLAERLKDPTITPPGLDVDAFLCLGRQVGNTASTPVLDVRSPAEFAHGHVPGAHSLPLFSNEERAAVGTAYKRKSREEALVTGMAFVEPKLHRLVEEAKALISGGDAGLTGREVDVAVYCWRGGMRSGSVAWLLRRHGLRVATLSGGYKAFRRWVGEQWGGLTLPRPRAKRSPDQSRNRESEETAGVPTAVLEAAKRLPGPRICVVGGRTGVGKTRVLHALRDTLGEQVLDLEALARHRGSAFGWCGQGGLPQPSTEHFANLVAMEWTAIVREGRPWVFIEDEDNHIGACEVPAGMYALLRCAPLVVRIGLGEEARVRLLLEDYAGQEAMGQGRDEWRAAMEASIGRLQKRLGGALVKELLAKLHSQDHEGIARALLAYYDRLYDKHVANGGGTGSGEGLRPGVVLEAAQDESLTELNALALAQQVVNRVAEFEASEAALRGSTAFSAVPSLLGRRWVFWNDSKAVGVALICTAAVMVGLGSAFAMRTRARRLLQG